METLKLGKILYDNNNLNFNITNIKIKGKNSVRIKFASAKHAKLSYCNIYIPPINIISMGVISDITITEQEIQDNAESRFEILNHHKINEEDDNRK